jgi:hypothetical protein
MKRLPGPLLSLALAGCIFNADPDYTSRSFQVGFYATLGNVYAYDASGHVTGSLGLGAEDLAYLPARNTQGSGIPERLEDDQPLWYGDAWKNPWLSYDTTSDTGEYYQPLEGHSYVLSLQRDSTKILTPTTSPNPFIPSVYYKTLHAYAGMPCKFSRLRGAVWNASANAGIPLVIESVTVRLVNDTLRLSMIVDTTASRAAYPAIEFSKGWMNFYGTMRVSCP